MQLMVIFNPRTGSNAASLFEETMEDQYKNHYGKRAGLKGNRRYSDPGILINAAQLVKLFVIRMLRLRGIYYLERDTSGVANDAFHTAPARMTE